MYKVICAAVRHKDSGVIVTGVRHFDEIMSKSVMVHNPEGYGSKYEQGFVDSFGNFLNRKDAMKRVRELKQPLQHTDKEWFTDELYSENLY